MARSLAEQVYDLCFETVGATTIAHYSLEDAGLGENGDGGFTDRELHLVDLGTMGGAAAALAAVADPVAGEDGIISEADRIMDVLVPRRVSDWGRPLHPLRPETRQLDAPTRGELQLLLAKQVAGLTDGNQLDKAEAEGEPDSGVDGRSCRTVSHWPGTSATCSSRSAGPGACETRTAGRERWSTHRHEEGAAEQDDEAHREPFREVLRLLDRVEGGGDA